MQIMLATDRSERGFTKVELLVSIAIVGVLCSIALTSFWVYKDGAEYTKAESDLRNARVAIEAGEQDLGIGASIVYTETADTGGPVLGVLQPLLPELGTSKDVVVGAQFDYCDNTSPAMQVNRLIVSKACKANLITQYVRFCSGIEVITDHVGGAC